MTSFTGIRRQLSEQAFLSRLTLFFSLFTLGGHFIELFGVGKRGGAFFTDQDWRFAESERAGDVAEVRWMGSHPLLGVTVCTGCLFHYNFGTFEVGEDGNENFCRWCGAGGWRVVVVS